MSNDPNRPGDNEKDDKHAEREGENIVRIVRAAAQMQKEDKVNTDLRQSEHDQPDSSAGGPQ